MAELLKDVKCIKIIVTKLAHVANIYDNCTVNGNDTPAIRNEVMLRERSVKRPKIAENSLTMFDMLTDQISGHKHWLYNLPYSTLAPDKLPAYNCWQ